jgi:hypothetical protein
LAIFHDLTPYKKFIKNLLNSNEPSHELIENSYEKIKTEILSWYEYEDKKISKINGIPRFHMDLRRLNLTMLFKESGHKEFIDFFNFNNQISNSKIRFFSLIDHIQMITLNSVIGYFFKKFLTNITTNSVGFVGSPSLEEVTLLINDGYYWIWLLPEYLYILRDKPIIDNQVLID